MASTIRPEDIVNTDSGDQALLLDVREQFTKAKTDIEALQTGGFENLGVSGVATFADGTLASPSILVGALGGGFYKGGALANNVQPVVGITLDPPTGRGIQFGYFPASTTAITIEPAPAFTSTSAGQSLTIRGGVPVDGNGGSTGVVGGAGVGTNRNGGASTFQGGGATGTGTGGSVNLFGGSSPSGPAGGVDIRTGTGSTVAINIRNRTSGSVVLWSGDVERFSVQAGSFRPQADNAYSGGEGSFRFTELYAVSGTINTSDIRLKDIDAEAFPDPVALLNAIDPIAYRWIEGRKVVVGRQQVGVEVIDGVEEPVFEPVYESQPGTRVHLGFSAQQVYEALGSDQYALWTLDDPNDTDSRQGLRTDQMIPILWAALKTALARIEALENQ